MQLLLSFYPKFNNIYATRHAFSNRIHDVLIPRLLLLDYIYLDISWFYYFFVFIYLSIALFLLSLSLVIINIKIVVIAGANLSSSRVFVEQTDKQAGQADRLTDG